MSKCFLLFPEDFPTAEKNSLCDSVYSQCFLELTTYTDKNHREFLFDNDSWTTDSIRLTFKIPQIIHSKLLPLHLIISIL